MAEKRLLINCQRKGLVMDGRYFGDWRGTNLGVLIMFGLVNAAAQLVRRTHRKHLSRFALTRTGIRSRVNEHAAQRLRTEENEVLRGIL